MDELLIQLSATTDAAGKVDVNAYNNGNEDNLWLSMPLTETTSDLHAGDQLPPEGLLMVVADGMGGMNAGEVASEIAIDTVRHSFTPERLAEFDISDPGARAFFLESIIKQADANVKYDSEHNPDRKNMGSTIVIAWIYGTNMLVSWLGDSRAYLYRRGAIKPVTKDHSLVQTLVDIGEITYDEAFDHPKNNIVLKSLGDPNHEAKPSTVSVDLEPGDVILMCSDGLTGVLRDRNSFDAEGKVFPQENLEDIISTSQSLSDCSKRLWEACERGGWYDNVTTVLCRIVPAPGHGFDTFGACPQSMPPTFDHDAVNSREPVYSPGDSANIPEEVVEDAVPVTYNHKRKPKRKPKRKFSWLTWLFTVVAVLIVAGIAVIGYFMVKDDGDQPKFANSATDNPTDTINDEQQPAVQQENILNDYEESLHSQAQKPQHDTRQINAPKQVTKPQTQPSGRQNVSETEGQDGTPNSGGGGTTGKILTPVSTHDGDASQSTAAPTTITNATQVLTPANNNNN